jgi:alcohol dehydrogenase
LANHPLAHYGQPLCIGPLLNDPRDAGAESCVAKGRESRDRHRHSALPAEAAKRTAKSETLNASEVDVVQALRDMTGGRGADICVDAVGLEADRTTGDKLSGLAHGEAGIIKVLQTCISAVRRGGVVTVVGVYGSPYSNFPLGQIFDKGITMRFGQSTPQKDIDFLLDWVQQGKVRLDDIISHRLPLEEAPRGYEIFCNKMDDCVKVVLKP